jgi:hypothetical protein
MVPPVAHARGDYCGGGEGNFVALDVDSLRVFLEERNAALVALDEDYVSRSVPSYPPEMRLLVLHKSRYECTAIAPELRHASRAWLAERGFKRMTGDELLPEGELPE